MKTSMRRLTAYALLLPFCAGAAGDDASTEVILVNRPAAIPVESVTVAAEVPHDSPSSSLLANRPLPRLDSAGEPGHQLAAVSMFYVAEPEPREFQVHDLVQIIVRESSTTRRSQELQTKKEFDLDGGVSAWPAFDLAQLLQLRLQAGETSGLPEVNLDFNKKFKGDGEYQREDELTDRLTAQVVEILPNGNLVLEARTSIKTDEEISVMKITGTCRSDDVSPANSILSSQMHGLTIERTNEGELKRTNTKGLIAKVLEAVFAF
ncbi:MAG: flagellar basal body L-ring protein FlgH [Phycisphaerales bacterium]|nr:flagellar basal body L-ring protein FlgH [Phycisphaerales bacterium]